VTRNHLAVLVLGAFASFAAATSADARLNGVHWQTSGHFHPPQLQVGWYPISHWITPQGGPITLDPTKGFLPGFIASGGTTITGPADLGATMYSLSLMDDQMNTLVHRDTADLTLLRHAWSLERTGPGADGYAFHLLDLAVATDDGFTSNLVAPVAVPLTLVSFEPDPTAGPGLYAGVFRGMIPAGALGYSMVEPLFASSDPFVLFNDEAAPLELLVTIDIPEPAAGMLGVVGAALAFARRRRE
jgi:hypothetical protein